MDLIDKLKRRRVLLSFEIALGKANEIAVKTVLAEPGLENLELIRFWAFATARILYELWFANTPQAFLAIYRLSLIIERDLDPATQCLKRAELYQFRYVSELPAPVERLAGEYLGRDETERMIRFLGRFPFDGSESRPLGIVAGVALLQHVIDKLRANRRSLQVLSATARMLLSQFAIEEWAGEASVDKLPHAAFNQALRQGVKAQ